jgi:hypothetical protein
MYRLSLSWCSETTDCYNCTTGSWYTGGISACHWCPAVNSVGGICVTKGDPRSCLIGLTCASPPDCIRTIAEFKGYEAPPAKAVILFIFIAIILIAAFVSCLWCCFAIWDKRRLAALKSRVESRRAQTAAAAAESNNRSIQPGSSMQLSSLPVSAAFRNSTSSINQTGNVVVTSSPSGSSVSVSTKKKRTGELQETLLESKNDSSSDAESVGGGQSRRYAVRMNERGVAEVMLVDPVSAVSPETTQAARTGVAPIPFPPTLPPLPRKQALLRQCGKIGLGMAILGTFIALLVACLLFPHMPQYSMCNKQIQWGTILTNMKNFDAAVDVDLQVSVWNPNRFIMNLKKVDARVLYHTDVVGTGSVYDVTFPAGSIDDFIVTVAFSPSITSAANMLRDHLAGQLLLDVLLDIDASVLLGRFAHPLLQLNTSYVIEGIDAEGEASRLYCKCKDPNVGEIDTTTTITITSIEDAFTQPAQLTRVVPRIGAGVQQHTTIMNTRATMRLSPAVDLPENGEQLTLTETQLH